MIFFPIISTLHMSSYFYFRRASVINTSKCILLSIAAQRRPRTPTPLPNPCMHTPRQSHRIQPEIIWSSLSTDSVHWYKLETQWPVEQHAFMELSKEGMLGRQAVRDWRFPSRRSLWRAMQVWACNSSSVRLPAFTSLGRQSLQKWTNWTVDRD